MFLKPKQALHHMTFFQEKKILLQVEDHPLSAFSRYKPLLFQRNRPLHATATRFVVEATLLRSWTLIHKLLLPLERAEPEKTKNAGTHEKDFLRERLPISQLLPQENTINSSVMRTLIHTQISCSSCDSSYCLCVPVPACWLTWNKRLTLEEFS